MASQVLAISAAGQVEAGDTATFPSEYDNGNQGATWTLDWNNGQKQKVTLTASTTSLTITAPTTGVGNFLLKIVQDASGPWTVAWPASVNWPGGTAPTLSGASATDIISMYWDGTAYWAVGSLNFS